MKSGKRISCKLQAARNSKSNGKSELTGIEGMEGIKAKAEDKE